MRELYRDLLQKLNDGHYAAVVTRYEGKKIEKTLYCDDEPEVWARLAETAETPGMVVDGPVSHRKEGSRLTMIEHYTPRPRMVILGGGHIALALSKMAKMIDFNVLVFDDRPQFANPGRFPDADEVICDSFGKVFERIKVRSEDYIVIVTRGHKNDTECLEGVLKGEIPAYIGMIGSKRRVAIVLKQLESQGYPKEMLDCVHTPIGLRIGAVTPAEISISILGEIIAVKRKEHGTAEGRTSDIEIVAWLAEHGAEADALITILTTKGPVPRETGAKMAMAYEGRTVNTIGGGCAESDVLHRARTIIREGGYEIVTVDMTDTAEEDGMVCGGTMQVVIEAF